VQPAAPDASSRNRLKESRFSMHHATTPPRHPATPSNPVAEAEAIVREAWLTTRCTWCWWLIWEHYIRPEHCPAVNR
jgi:hypothetical protein